MAEISNIQYVGGAFMMDGQQFDLQTLMMALQSERANLIESQLVDQANQIKARNTLLAAANTYLAECRTARQNGTPMSAACEKFFTDNGVTISKTTDKKYSKEQWDVHIENLKGFIDTLNSSSQMDMIRLQGLTSKRDQAFEMMTNLMSKLAKTMDAIVANMR